MNYVTRYLTHMDYLNQNLSLKLTNKIFIVVQIYIFFNFYEKLRKTAPGFENQRTKHCSIFFEI